MPAKVLYFCRTLIVLSVLTAAVCQAADKRVACVLRCYAPGSNDPVESVKVGQEFDLALIVQDLRGDIPGRLRGVFSLYCNANYNTQAARLKWVQYNSPFVNGKNCWLGQYGLMRWGAFAGLNPGDRFQHEVSRCRMVARWPFGAQGDSTAVEISPTFTRLAHPRDDTGVYGTLRPGPGFEYLPGEQQLVLVEEIEASGVTLNVNK